MLLKVDLSESLFVTYNIDIILSMKGFILLVKSVEANLHTTHKSDIGFQFFNNFLSLFPFGYYAL